MASGPSHGAPGPVPVLWALTGTAPPSMTIFTISTKASDWRPAGSSLMAANALQAAISTGDRTGGEASISSKDLSGHTESDPGPSVLACARYGLPLEPERRTGFLDTASEVSPRPGTAHMPAAS